MSKKDLKLLVSSFVVLIAYISAQFLNSGEYSNELLPSPKPPNPTVLSVNTTEPLSNTFTVTKIIDGDTIELSNKQKVRYIGIDTPETVDPRRPDGCFGREASEKNKELVLGKTVTLEKDVNETDRFGRLLRYVYVDGQMVNEVLVRDGYAKAVTFPPDVKYQSKFTDLEKSARENKAGLWSSCPI